MANKVSGKSKPRGETDAETGKTVLPNIGAIDANIQDGFKKRYELERQIEALSEEHLKPIKDELKKVKKNTSADTGVDATDLNNHYRIFRREQDAKLMEDDDRTRILDNIKTVHGALASGQMVDFISVLVATPQTGATAH